METTQRTTTQTTKQGNRCRRESSAVGALARPGLIAAALVAVVALGNAPAQALPDLQITAMSVQGTPREGACNSISMTVRNAGDQFTNVAGIKIFLATYTQNNSNLNRAENNQTMIGPIQPGQQTTFTISNVEFKAQGGMTVQALVDFDNQVAESNENNNTSLLNTNVSGSCYVSPTPTPASACDLEATFTAPTGTTATGPEVGFTVRFQNKGQGPCKENRIKLMRYSSSSCSGYGSQVGGSGALLPLNALAAGASQDLNWTDKVTRGRYCYKPVYSSPHNDLNNFNHHPTKPLSIQ
jgi:hypothetical protein